MFKEVHTSLLSWYLKYGRHNLPWRQTHDPYLIWISEIMLQQTQVKTVLERFYFPFLEAFPAIEDLASATLDDVLKKWEGLGYYTRAKNLHKAAQVWQKKVPQTAEEFERLPGIGRSTAHAIAAFSYKEPVPILDANVKRILYRFFAIQKRDEKQLWQKAYTLFDSRHPFEYNQAMMDLGSIICTPKNPKCDECPFKTLCSGKNTPSLYPQKNPSKNKPIKLKTILISFQNNKLILKQRTGRFLHGLWGFIEKERYSPPDSYQNIGSITQQYTHFTLDAEIYITDEAIEEEGAEWFEFKEIDTLSLSRADHKVLELLRYNIQSIQGNHS